MTLEEAQERAKEHLAGFPPEITDAYLSLAATNDPALLDQVVLGVLTFYLAKQPEAPLGTLPGSTRLREDLGADSLAMIDVIFLAEELFAIKVADDELARIATLDALRVHFRALMWPACAPRT